MRGKHAAAAASRTEKAGAAELARVRTELTAARADTDALRVELRARPSAGDVSAAFDRERAALADLAESRRENKALAAELADAKRWADTLAGSVIAAVNDGERATREAFVALAEMGLADQLTNTNRHLRRITPNRLNHAQENRDLARGRMIGGTS